MPRALAPERNRERVDTSGQQWRSQPFLRKKGTSRNKIGNIPPVLESDFLLVARAFPRIFPPCIRARVMHTRRHSRGIPLSRKGLLAINPNFCVFYSNPSILNGVASYSTFPLLRSFRERDHAPQTCGKIHIRGIWKTHDLGRMKVVYIWKNNVT